MYIGSNCESLLFSVFAHSRHERGRKR